MKNHYEVTVKYCKPKVRKATKIRNTSKYHTWPRIAHGKLTKTQLNITNKRGSGHSPLEITSCYMYPQKYWYRPPIEEPTGPLGSNCFSREVHMAYVDDLKTSGPHLADFFLIRPCFEWNLTLGVIHPEKQVRLVHLLVVFGAYYSWAEEDYSPFELSARCFH